MQAFYPPAFDREQGCTDAEWRRMLPGAVDGHALAFDADGRGATVTLGGGALRLDWTVMPPRAIALIRMPRLAVRYRFDAVDEAVRQAFMKRFDLHIQRGGG